VFSEEKCELMAISVNIVRPCVTCVREIDVITKSLASSSCSATALSVWPWLPYVAGLHSSLLQVHGYV
jgi:hypothetical protein